jgi:hypothetical protein
LRLADLEVTKSLPHELVWRVDPVILTLLRRSPGPVARKRIKPFCFLLEELGVVDSDSYLQYPEIPDDIFQILLKYLHVM